MYNRRSLDQFPSSLHNVSADRTRIPSSMTGIGRSPEGPEGEELSHMNSSSLKPGEKSDSSVELLTSCRLGIQSSSLSSTTDAAENLRLSSDPSTKEEHSSGSVISSTKSPPMKSQGAL
ncbi:hypothetical protein C8T65DRAFT_38062 [Cerioporus squamosus]|nr:hypothetical protein C8T65DRAFT_38062 [Cerioporus squamosus]